MRRLLSALVLISLLSGCGDKDRDAEGRPIAEVSAMTVVPRDTPISYTYVGQTESSHQVQIVARVSGFLQKRVYTEGSLVKAGEVLFQQDPKPYQATLNAYQGALAQEQARLKVAEENLAQVKPLAALNALSVKELNDATGQQQAAAAAVLSAKANVEQAELNLSYTTIRSPVTGLSSYAQVQEGQYLNGIDSQLTYVSQLDPIWVNFSLSENDVLSYRNDVKNGRILAPKDKVYVVEVQLADGNFFPLKGRITFANPDYNQDTGTYFLRATIPNPEAVLKPGQFVNVRVSGMTRPNAIAVPQQSVLQGAKGHFVFVIDKENKAQIRPVQVGPWNGDDWFIDAGLAAGDTVVTDGFVRLGPGATVRITNNNASPAAAATSAKP